MNLHDAWTALRHGGNLLSPAALGALPEPAEPQWGLADRLRAALLALGPEKPAAPALGALLDVVLEDACGLREGWQKGSALGAADAEKLLDGTVLKPRRRWTGPEGEPLLVFTTAETRIGVGRGRRPAAQVVEYLRRRGLPLALVTNGPQWRLVWADPDNLAFAEWEADRWLAAEEFTAELAVLRRVLSPASLLKKGGDASPLLAAIRDTRRGQAKLSAELGERVRRAVETLLTSRRPLIEPAWQDHQSTDLYVAACHFVMRLVVTLFAEARELLPVESPVYHRAYGLRALLAQLDRQTPERRRAQQMAWPRLLALFRLLHRGSPHPALLLPAYGGDLFRPGEAAGDGVQRALALLEALPEPPDDDVIHRVLVLLTRTTQRLRDGAGWRTVAAPVDFTELTSEYIGILYEGLLDYELHRAGSEPVLFLALGDQPALPLDRLEAMDDKALAALVEKAKVKRRAASAEEGEGEDEEGGDDEALDSDDDAQAEEPEGDESRGGGEDAALAPGELPGDARAAAQARALAWGRRAVEVGKLVAKPRGRSAEARAAWEAQRDVAAGQLVADLKLPGELYLVRWGGTRKGAGTFYTRPQLTLPTVRRTLEPLIYEAGAGAARRVRPPEALLALKLCDPAMGSGSFLVASLRVLTEAVVTSLHEHGRIERANGATRVRCDLLPEADRSLATEGFEERLEATLRRAVVEHCLYGVDKDPLAVELARVALWVETLDRRLPFTFLDHKLRCGDALVGTWLDRFRDYPLLAWSRQSPDEKWRGVTHEGDQWAKALKEGRKQVVSEQAERLTGQAPLFPSAVSDQEVRTAIERVRELTRRLHAVPASQPDKRAELWRSQVAPDPALARVREAFDTWCALWFWPLDRLGDAPTPATLLAPPDEARRVVARLREQQRFFHWELEFPDVFREPGAGFDAVVGNPPWEIQKPSSKEFFSDRDPLYRSYGKQEALLRQREIFEADPATERAWLDHVGRFKNLGNFVRYAAEPFGDAEDAGGKPEVALALRRAAETKALHEKWAAERRRHPGLSDPEHPFRFQGSADLNTYKMFVEAGHALLRAGGQMGLVVPSGLYTDKGSAELRRLLLERCRWRWLYGFENRNKLFDIHRSFKFCVAIAEKGGATEAIQAAFMRHDLEDWAEAKGRISYERETLRHAGLGIDAFFEVGGQTDKEVLARIFAGGESVASLGNDGSVFTRELDKTNDSKRLHPRRHLEDWGLENLADRDFRRASDRAHLLAQGWTPVWEGKCCRFDEWVADPTLFARVSEVADSLRGEFTFGFRRIARNTDARTLIGCVVPPMAATTYTIEVARDLSRMDSEALYAAMTSLAIDWVMRFQVSSSVALFNLHAIPLPKAPWQQASAFLSHAVRGLLAESSHVRRLARRVQNEAIVAAMYGLSRDDFRWILRDCDHPRSRLSDKQFCRALDPKGFWRVERDYDPELRHTVLSLIAFDALESLIQEHGGDISQGIRAFQAINNGEGWPLPEELCLADHDLGHDERAQQSQAVASRLQSRVPQGYLAGPPEESWTEYEGHARAILGDDEFERRFAEPRTGHGDGPVTRQPHAAKPQPAKPAAPQLPLFGDPPDPRIKSMELRHMTISQIRLLNFRNWTDAHWQSGVELKPITLVLGRNSAGKTTILQPLRMLKQTIEASDAGTHLLLNAGAADGSNFGAFTDVVNGHDPKREVGVGFDLEQDGLSVDVRFRQVDERPVIESLVYRFRDEQVEVSRTSNAYKLASPRFRLPNWDGARDAHKPTKAYEPGRAIELSEQALQDLGPTLGPQVREAMLAVKRAFKSFHHLGPLRPPPAREVTWSQQDPTHLGSTGSETVQALIGNETGRSRGTLKQSVSEWLKRLDLADGLEISRVGSSLLYQIEILSGHGRSNLADVGFGVSQVLPVIVLLHFVQEGSVILCEDPEAHLHPMAQAGLADLFVETAKRRNLQILLETHSEHLFRRLQYLVAAGSARSKDCALYYVERDEPTANVTALDANDFGQIANWPEHFFGDAMGETERQVRKIIERKRSSKDDGKRG